MKSQKFIANTFTPHQISSKISKLKTMITKATTSRISKHRFHENWCGVLGFVAKFSSPQMGSKI